MQYQRKKRLELDQYITGILSGDRIILSKAITLIESHLEEDNLLAERVLEEILPYTGKSFRIGITGVPGVGKSTFIESLGSFVTSLDKKLAVLTIDPSSKLSKGSILGDKTRMEELAVNPKAYIRPSPSGSALGGVSSKTRETMLLCEAAGYDVIFIETVGVGQSETTVRSMVDFFLLLMLAGAGDELQGIKKGIMEMADSVVITKSDGDNIKMAQRAKREYENALHLFPPSAAGWQPQVLTCSAVTKDGIKEIWDVITLHHDMMRKNDFFTLNRIHQNVEWMHEIITSTLESRFYNHPAIKKNLKSQEEKVISRDIPAITAAKQLLDMIK